MDRSTPWILLIIFTLLDLYLAAVRAAFANAQPARLNTLSGPKPKAIVAAVKTLERPRLRASFRLVMGLAHFLIAACLGWLYLENAETLPAALLLAVMAVSVILLVLLEALAERAPLKQPELWAVRLRNGALGVDVLMTPLSMLLVKTLGSKLSASTGEYNVTEDELKSWAETEEPGGELEQGERRMIYSIFQFGDTLCREVMVPRMDVLALDVNTSLQDAVKELLRSGHSRVPVYEDTIDNIVGMLYAKDLLKIRHDQTPAPELRGLLRQAYFVPESKKVDELLREMQAEGIHMVIVVDEYGGMAGVVTLEDIVEEIVGEIRDEYDEGEEIAVQQISADEYLFIGKVPLDDVNEVLDTSLTAELADSLGGFVFSRLGRVPQQGDCLEVENWNFCVEEIHGQRIGKIRAKRLAQTQPSKVE